MNRRIVTVDSARPEAEAIAMRGPTILAVGSNTEIGKLIGDSTEVVDLQGRLAIPGFIESHGHYMGLGRAKMILDLTTAKRWDDIVESVSIATHASRYRSSWSGAHSERRATFGSTCAARMAGTSPAAAATTIITPAVPTYTTGSRGETPNSNGAT